MSGNIKSFDTTLRREKWAALQNSSWNVLLVLQTRDIIQAWLFQERRYEMDSESTWAHL